MTDILTEISGDRVSPALARTATDGGQLEPNHQDGTNRQDYENIEQCVVTSSAPLMKILKDSLLAAPCDVDAVQKTRTRSKNASAPRLTTKREEAVRDLLSYMPSAAVMDDIFENHCSWWPLYRDTFGLTWGGDVNTLREFAAQALSEGNPASLGLLLTCFAFASGDPQAYLPPVERHIRHDEQLAATENGLSCLMALGLCYLAALQPRRAWMVYRFANSILQLNGLHLTHARSPKLDSLFWQLLHADRWCSLMIGLPSSVMDRVCDVEIPSLKELSPATYMYRRLAIITVSIFPVSESFRLAQLTTSCS